MDLDTILRWIQLGTEHKYLLLAIAFIGWATSLTSDWSKFPITVPARWQPVVASSLGLIYGVLVKIQDGTPWQKAIVGGLLVALATGGLYELVINAIFAGKIPTWLAWLALAKNPKDTHSRRPPPLPPSDRPTDPPVVVS